MALSTLFLAKVKVTLRLTDSQSVCLGVEPNLELWARDFFKVTVLSFWGAFSHKRPGLSFVSLCLCSLQQSVTIYNKYLHLIKNLHSVTHIYNTIQYMPASLSPGFVQKIMPYLLGTTAVLDTWTVIYMTAVKFEPLIFSVWSLALSNVTNIFIFMILDDFCLLPAKFCYVIINARNLESHMHIADRCVPRKIADGAENLILQALQFQ
jgi:hypothetical protein